MSAFSALGGAFQVNTTTSGAQSDAALAWLQDGTLVAVWQDSALDGDQLGIVFQRFAADGTPLGVETLATVTTASVQMLPDVTALALEPIGGDLPRVGAPAMPPGLVFRVTQARYETLSIVVARGGARAPVAWPCARRW